MTDGGAERLAAMFAAARSDNRAVLLPFMTAGLPDPESSLDMFEAMANAGADGFEVGIPYSDPLMDGPVIQEAGARALAAGTSLDRSLDIIASVVARTGKPTLAMTYVNPILAAGIEEFASRLAAAGAAGLIVPDLPADEARAIKDAVERAGVAMVLFAAPTTDDARLQAIVAAKPAFVYGVAELGVTGERAQGGGRSAGLVARIRAAGDVPVVLGVGISTPEQAAAAAAVADGVIVGSAVVRRVLDAPAVDAAVDAVGRFVGELSAAVRR